MDICEIEPRYDFEKKVFAKDQPEYNPLPALVSHEGVVISAWQPTAEELALILEGKPIYLSVHTFKRGLPPVLLTVGDFPAWA